MANEIDTGIVADRIGENRLRNQRTKLLAASDGLQLAHAGHCGRAPASCVAPTGLVGRQGTNFGGILAKLELWAPTLPKCPRAKAHDDQRIATSKIEQAKLKLADLQRTESKPRNARFFPSNYATVIVVEARKRIIYPMRYGCRQAGKPASYDTRYPGTYNARRDNLEGFWKGQFGHSHALMVVETFYENVEGEDGRNRVLQFAPRDGGPMYVACLWSRWADPKGVEPDLLSFAAITDTPEPEVAAAGHDRTIINPKPDHIDAWLNPDPANLGELYATFDDKQHPYYEYREAAYDGNRTGIVWRV